ncbi:hypothetical protein [Brevundimonas nasdae]|uniref:hypothetical protein n=1 Tax=Brevundimonas nasdae TaxID=172043 RepID=UPI003F690F96
MNLAIHARRPAAFAHSRSADVRARPRSTPKIPLARPWFVRAGLVLAAYQARSIEGGF